MQVAIYTTIINTENTGLPHFVQALTPVLCNGLCNIQQVRKIVIGCRLGPTIDLNG